MGKQKDGKNNEEKETNLLLNRRSLLECGAALVVSSAVVARANGAPVENALDAKPGEAGRDTGPIENSSYSLHSDTDSSSRVPDFPRSMPLESGPHFDPHATEDYIKSLVEKFLAQVSTRNTEDLVRSFVHDDVLVSTSRHEFFSNIPAATNADGIYRFLGEEFIPDYPTRYVVLENSAYNPLDPAGLSPGDASGALLWPDVMVSAAIVSRWTERIASTPVVAGAGVDNSVIPLTAIYRLTLIWVRQHPVPEDPLGPLVYKIAHLHLSPWKGKFAATLNYQKPDAVEARPYLPQVTHRPEKRPTLPDGSVHYPTPLNSPKPGGSPVHHWPSETFIRDAIALHFGRAKSSIWWIFDGWEVDVEGWGTKNNPANPVHMLGESANFVETAEHYNGLFSAFAPEFTLVSDNAIVAGPFLIQSYHATARVVVDKTKSPGFGEKQIIFHGHTIYKVEKSGKISWRWSNHYNEIWSSQFQHWMKEHRNSVIRDWFPDPFFLIEDSNLLPVVSERDPASVSELYIRDMMFRFFSEMSRGSRSRSVDQRVTEIKEFIQRYFGGGAFDAFYVYPQRKVIDPSDPLDPGLDLLRVDGLYSELSLIGKLLNNLLRYEESYTVMDEIVVCGNYAGVKYHQSFKAEHGASTWKLIRGQAIFEFCNDGSGLIRRAWDNPDESV